MSDNSDIPVAHRAFSIPLILANIFFHVALKRDILPFCSVNRWWNQLATERLWNKFQGLKNDSRTQAFSKFLKVLQDSHSYYSDPIANEDKKCFHEYGRYVKILDLEKLKIRHENLLTTLECCPRIEQLIMGNCLLSKTQMYDIAKRLPELKSFKFIEIDINDGEALGAIAEYCLMLEELNLKRDISCDGKVLLDITKNCRRLVKLEIEEKYYEDDIMLPCLSNCPNLTFFRIHQCISISENFLLSLYKSCPKLTDVTITNVSDITTEFAIETFKHFKQAKVLTIQCVERYLESKIEAKEQAISVHLYDADLGRIIDYFKNNDDDTSGIYNNNHLLKELTLVDFSLSKPILGIICEGLDQLTKLDLQGVQGLTKPEVLEIIPKLKNIRHFLIRFSFPVPSLLHEDTAPIFEKCSQLELIQWNFQRCNRNDNA